MFIADRRKFSFRLIPFTHYFSIFIGIYDLCSSLILDIVNVGNHVFFHTGLILET